LTTIIAPRSPYAWFEAPQHAAFRPLAELEQPVQVGGFDHVPGRVRAQPQHSGGRIHPERARAQLLVRRDLRQRHPVDENHVRQPGERRGLVDDLGQEAGPAQLG
jgi:hypothetical protein